MIRRGGTSGASLLLLGKKEEGQKHDWTCHSSRLYNSIAFQLLDQIFWLYIEHHSV